MNSLRISFFSLLLLTSSTLMSQINKPSLSPRIVTEQKVGLANVTLDYGQPNKQGRQVFGGLIPYGRLWRTGANASTKVTIDREVSLAGNLVPAGTYGLYSIPGKKEWTIILHKNSGLWGAGGYDQANDLLRFTTPAIELKDTRETFAIYFENFNTNGGDMVIAWENAKVAIPLFVDSDAAIFQEIEEKITKATEAVKAQTYFDAAQFYLLKKVKLDLAKEWFDQAIEMRPAAFWYVYYRAELAYELGDLATAKALTEKCLTAAKASPSSDFGYISKCTLLLAKLEQH